MPWPSPNKAPAIAASFGSGFVAKFDPSKVGAASLVWSSYFAGSGSTCDDATGVAVDTGGNAYVVGNTGGPAGCGPSIDLPTTKNAFQASYPGSTNGAGWVARFNKSGRQMWASYLGGTSSRSNTNLSGIAESGGKVFVTGCAWDDNSKEFSFPQVGQIAGVQGTYHPTLVSEFSASGNSLTLSTLLGGGSGDGDCGGAIALDSLADAYVVGTAADNGSGTNFPTTPGAFQTGCENYNSCGNGSSDAFVYTLRGSDIDLGVSDTPSSSTATTGQPLTFTIQVENSGTATASNVILRTSVPSGAKFESASITAGHCSTPRAGATKGNIACSGFNLPVGNSAALTLTLQVAAASGAIISNDAAVSNHSNDYNLTNNSITASVQVQ